MKEKIIEILKSNIHADGDIFVMWYETGFNDIANEIEALTDAEVKRQIENRMPTIEADILDKWIVIFNLFSDTSAFCHGYHRMREERDELRLKGGEK